MSIIPEHNLNVDINNKRVHEPHSIFRTFETKTITEFMFTLTKQTHFQFFNGKTSSNTQFSVVSDRWTSNNWTKGTSSRTWEQSFRFFDPILTSSLLSGRLIEPGSHMLLPIFMEMSIRDHIISFTHLELVSGTKIINNR